MLSLNNKKVLLRERKRHTARRVAVASACYSVLFRGQGGYLDMVYPPQRWGTPLSKVGVPPGDGVPPFKVGVPPRRWGTLPCKAGLGTPLSKAGLGPPPIQSLIGYPPPPVEVWTDKLKTVPSPILRMRAVKIKVKKENCRVGTPV